MTFVFRFCSVLYGVGFGFLHIFLLLGSVLSKSWVLDRLVPAKFGFFAISIIDQENFVKICPQASSYPLHTNQ